MKTIKQAKVFLLIVFMISVCLYSPLNQGKYKILHEIKGLLDNGGTCYYVLVPPIKDLMKDINYKTNIKKVIKKIVHDKGEKLWISFFDDKALLEKYYQNKLKTSTYSESKEELIHHIADYNGKIHTGNWLIFFPAFLLPIIFMT